VLTCKGYLNKSFGIEVEAEDWRNTGADTLINTESNTNLWVVAMVTREEEKKKILEGIITSEEDPLLRLKRLVNASKPFLKVERNTGRAMISTEFEFTNAERITLLLLGKFFAMQYGIRKGYELTLDEIGSELAVKRTTLPAPLERLIDDGVVDKPKRNVYRISLYKVEYALRRLQERYLVGDRK
jgi:hypothetical protein